GGAAPDARDRGERAPPRARHRARRRDAHAVLGRRPGARGDTARGHAAPRPAPRPPAVAPPAATPPLRGIRVGAQDGQVRLELTVDPVVPQGVETDGPRARVFFGAPPAPQTDVRALWE